MSKEKKPEFVSIFNEVLGPVMRGPSSSHTAGAYHIGRMVRNLLGDEPASLQLTFDPEGSYAPTYLPLGVDLAFAVGVLGWAMTDERYFLALELARNQGVEIGFTVAPLDNPDHPNMVHMEMVSRRGHRLSAEAKSTGGGAIVFTRLGEWPVALAGKSHDLLVEMEKGTESRVSTLLDAEDQALKAYSREERDNEVLLRAQLACPPGPEVLARIEALQGVKNVWAVAPVFYAQGGEELFLSAEEMVKAAEQRGCSLGRIAMAYESQLLGLPGDEVMEEMTRRFEVMKSSVHQGLHERNVDMLLLEPTAGRVFESVEQGRAPTGGIHTRAAARSMAVMHVCNSRGVVCAAPTGGSAGVVPGTVVTLVEDRRLSEEEAVRALWAASAVGLIVARRATFAAEVAGCQVEIGVAGAMAAAAVVDAAGGSARQAADAAAIALQNTMGSVCDPVQGGCEIPCHTRNAIASSSALVCADLVMGGYHNPISLDETIDASYAVGKTLPRQLRCTALGGLAVTPSAQALPQLRDDS